MADQPEGLLAARIVIERRLTDIDDEITIQATDGDGNGIRLVEALGMLRYGETFLIRESLGDSDV